MTHNPSLNFSAESLFPEDVTVSLSVHAKPNNSLSEPQLSKMYNMKVENSPEINSTPLDVNSTSEFFIPAPDNRSFHVANGSISDHICKKILYIEIGNSRVRVWDLFLLIPVVLFFIGLLLKLNSARLRLRAVHSPIYATFYCLIWLNTLIALVRCIVSMTVNAATTSGDEANILLYVIVRFFLLATEMSVVVFAIFFGHLDNKTSIRRVLVVTSVIALPFSIVQGSLELLAPDPDFDVASKDYHLFGHGGSLFWLISSLLFALVYSFILLLRLNYLRKRFLFLLWMPMKRAFYVYLAFLALLNVVQSVGSSLYHVHIAVGLCVVDFTTWMYFSLLTPSIYYTFIYQFFRKKNPDQIENIVFSYKSEEEDTSSLPPNIGEHPNANTGFQHTNPPYSSLTEEECGGRENTASPPNPLYSASLQSPDSLTGYSINSCDSINITAYENS